MGHLCMFLVFKHNPCGMVSCGKPATHTLFTDHLVYLCNDCRLGMLASQKRNGGGAAIPFNSINHEPLEPWQPEE
jgi:hypothetical protein